MPAPVARTGAPAIRCGIIIESDPGLVHLPSLSKPRSTVFAVSAPARPTLRTATGARTGGALASYYRLGCPLRLRPSPLIGACAGVGWGPLIWTLSEACAVYNDPIRNPVEPEEDGDQSGRQGELMDMAGTA